MKRPALWRRLPEWGKAFVIALGLLAVLHLFVLRWVAVHSTSMYATLWPGDLVGVARWPKWTGFHRGDILVFRDPVQDDSPMRQRRLLVKRIVAMPGDELELRDGELFLNGMPWPAEEGQTSRWTVRIKQDADVADLLGSLGIPPDLVLPSHTVFDLPLNAAMAEQLQERPEVVTVVPARSVRRKGDHLFPHGPNYRWSNANYGPLTVPQAGDTVPLSAYTLPLYDRIITRYEHERLTVSDGQLLLHGEPAERYVIQQNYFFVLGDSRDHSEDSRYWGFVPADHAVGRASFVLLNARGRDAHPAKGRTLKSL